MNLLLVTGAFPQRSETFIYRKAVALAERGHRVTIASRNVGDWSLYPEPLPRDLRVEIFPPDGGLHSPTRLLAGATGAFGFARRSATAVRRLYDRCRNDPRTRDDVVRQFIRHLPFIDREVDLVHFEFMGLGAMYPLAGATLGAPVILSCRGQDVHTLDLRPERERRPLLECLQAADALHCVSDEMARSVARVAGRTTGVWVNRPAVDTEQIAMRPMREPRGALRILWAGRLVWVKGLDYFLGALRELDRRGVEFEAEILGDGELRSSVRFAVADLGLERRVTLVGGVSSHEVLARLQATDVFVLSSHEEGLSNVVLEAMASGVPVVTTNAGGMAEAVLDGVTGFVVPIRDSNAIADRVAQLATDRELSAEMGRAARLRAETEFSMPRQVAGFERIYRATCERAL